MNDYLQSMSAPMRRVGAGLAGLAALFAWAISVVCALLLIPDVHRPSGHVAAAAGLAIFGPLALYCTCLTWRLATGRRAGNGITVMPPWAIQGFGLFFVIGGLWSAFVQHSFWLAVECTTLAGAMILAGRNIAARKRRIAHRADPNAPET